MNAAVIFALVMFVQADAGNWMAAKAQQFLTEKQCQEAGEMYHNTYKDAVPGSVQHVWKCIKLTSKSPKTSI